MKKLIVAVAISLLIGFAAASWMDAGRVSSELLPIVTTKTNVASFDAAAPVDERVLALEQAVDQERRARQWLEQEIILLREEIGQRDDAVAATEEQQPSAVEERREAFRSRRFDYNPDQGQVDRLVAAGFPVGRAEWIVQREAELQMEMLQARYEAMRGNEVQRFFSPAPDSGLRADLGDADYERYLAANGRSTTVRIGNVIQSSPAEEAGLQAGDRIVRYDGRRVFSMMDVMEQIMQSQTGGNVVVDIERDGMPMQLVLPRGPLGVMGD